MFSGCLTSFYSYDVINENNYTITDEDEDKHNLLDSFITAQKTFSTTLFVLIFDLLIQILRSIVLIYSLFTSQINEFYDNVIGTAFSLIVFVLPIIITTAVIEKLMKSLKYTNSRNSCDYLRNCFITSSKAVDVYSSNFVLNSITVKAKCDVLKQLLWLFIGLMLVMIIFSLNTIILYIPSKYNDILNDSAYTIRYLYNINSLKKIWFIITVALLPRK